MWEGGSGWGTHVHPWLSHMNVWQKSPQYCKVISFQLKLKKEKTMTSDAKHLNIYLVKFPFKYFPLQKLGRTSFSYYLLIILCIFKI